MAMDSSWGAMNAIHASRAMNGPMGLIGTGILMHKDAMRVQAHLAQGLGSPGGTLNPEP
jgi:hypothetical protein